MFEETFIDPFDIDNASERLLNFFLFKMHQLLFVY